MSRSFLVDSLIGNNNSPPNYPLPYYGNQLPNYMFNLFNLGLGYQPVRPVPRPPTISLPNVPISPPVVGGLPLPRGHSPPSPLNNSSGRLSGKYSNLTALFSSIPNPFPYFRFWNSFLPNFVSIFEISWKAAFWLSMTTFSFLQILITVTVCQKICEICKLNTFWKLRISVRNSSQFIRNPDHKFPVFLIVFSIFSGSRTLFRRADVSSLQILITDTIIFIFSNGVNRFFFSLLLFDFFGIALFYNEEECQNNEFLILSMLQKSQRRTVRYHGTVRRLHRRNRQANIQIWSIVRKEFVLRLRARNYWSWSVSFLQTCICRVCVESK